MEQGTLTETFDIQASFRTLLQDWLNTFRIKADALIPSPIRMKKTYSGEFGDPWLRLESYQPWIDIGPIRFGRWTQLLAIPMYLSGPFPRYEMVIKLYDIRLHNAIHESLQDFVQSVPFSLDIHLKNCFPKEHLS
jgi:hypothetical protein